MIVFKDWQIAITGTIARQYDNLSRRIDVTGDLPEGFTWRLLVQCGSNADTILLTPTDTGVGAVLTADNLSVAGEYEIQLKGTAADGVTTRHTNIAVTYIPRSMTGVGAWPQVPTEFAQIEANITELYQHPPVPGSNGYWLVWDSDADEYVESQLPLPEATTGGASDHSKLKNRDAVDQHPMSAITGLADALAGKQPTGDYLTEEQDPTVPEWAKQPQKPAYTAQEVGALPDTTYIPSTAADVNAEPSGAVSQHNVSDAAHSDIRLLIQGLSERLSALADSDDTTLDQLSEVVSYIKSNRSLIEAITTSKVSVADIIDNLNTNVSNKPLSAAQGVALKALIDAITVPDKLPNPNALTFTGAMTGTYDGSEALTINIPSGGGGESTFEKVVEMTTLEDAAVISISTDKNGNPLSMSEFYVAITTARNSASTANNHFNCNVLPDTVPSYIRAASAIKNLTLFQDVYCYVMHYKVVGGMIFHEYASRARTSSGLNVAKYLENVKNIGISVSSGETTGFLSPSDASNGESKIDSAGKMYCITFGADSTECIFGAGTRVEVWAR